MKLSLTGRVTDCRLLSYRTPADSVAELVPEGLELLRRGPWAFWNVVLCRVRHVRPLGLPTLRDQPAITYHHVAYRLLVRAMCDDTTLLSGLYFLRSDADSAVVTALGDRLTDFRFHPAAIAMCEDGDRGEVEVTAGDGVGHARVVFEDMPMDQPAGSCFPSWVDAEQTLCYAPRSLAVRRNRLRLAEVGRRERDWRERRITVRDARFGFFEQLGQDRLTLEMATVVDPIDYRWTLGATRRLLPGATAAREAPAPTPAMA